MSDITEADLSGYSVDELRGLTRAGKLDHLLSPPDEAEAAVDEPEVEPDVVAVDQGARGTLAHGQVTQAELATMTPEAIAKATREGRLEKLLR